MTHPTDASEASPDTRQLPPADTLTREQYAGRSCIYCDTPITTGGYSAGISRGTVAGRTLDTEVYAGPCCPPTR